MPSAVSRLPQLATLELSGNQIVKMDSSVAKVRQQQCQAWTCPGTGSCQECLQEQLTNGGSDSLLLLHGYMLCRPLLLLCVQMTALRELDLSGNLLTELPLLLATLLKLEVSAVGCESSSSSRPACLTTCSERRSSASLQADSMPAQRPRRSRPGSSAGGSSSCWQLARGVLQVLRLENNRLECLPENFGQLHSLVKLDVSTNCLRQLPVSMGRLKRIQRVDAANNLLTRVPPSMGHLKSMKEFNLKHNSLDDRYRAKAEEGLSR